MKRPIKTLHEKITNSIEKYNKDEITNQTLIYNLLDFVHQIGKELDKEETEMKKTLQEAKAAAAEALKAAADPKERWVTKEVMIDKLKDLMANSDTFREQDPPEDNIWEDDMEVLPVIINLIEANVPDCFKARRAQVPKKTKGASHE